MSTIASLIVKIGADTTSLTRGLGEADRKINNFSGNATSGFGGMSTAVLGVGAAIVGIGVASVGAAIEWESAFAGVTKTVSGSAEEMQLLEDQLRSMATDTTNPVAGLENAAVTLARIAELGGSLGIATGDIASFTETIAMLDMATDLTAESAATMTAQFANITGMPVEDYDNFGSTLVDLGNKMAATEPMILEFALRLAGAGENAGLSEDQILAFSAALASFGLDPEAGGTAFSQTLNTITEAAARGGEKLDTLAEASGVTADAFRTGWADDPAGTLVTFLEGLGDMTPADRIATLDALGLSGIRVSDMLTRLSGNTGLVSDALDIANDAWTENNALQTEAEARFATTESQMNLLGNNLRELGVTLGEALLPVVNDVVSGITGFLNKLNQGDISGAGDDILNLAEGLSGVELPDFDTVISGWQTFFDSVGILIQYGRDQIDGFFNGVAVGFRSFGRDIEEFLTRVAVAKEDYNLLISLGTDSDAQIRKDLLLGNINAIESAEGLEQQIRDSLTAGNLAIDMSQFVTTDPAAIAAKIADPVLIQEALNTALAEGDQATFDVLAPIAMELGINPDDLVTQYQTAISAAAASTEFTAQVQAKIYVHAASIDFSAVSGTVSGGIHAAANAAGGQIAVPALASGGYVNSGGVAVIHPGEAIIPADVTRNMNLGNGSGGNTINIQTNDADQLINDLKRQGIDLYAMAAA